MIRWAAYKGRIGDITTKQRILIRKLEGRVYWRNLSPDWRTMLTEILRKMVTGI